MSVVQKQEIVVSSPGDVSTWTPAQFDLLKRQFCKDLSDDEFQIFRYAVQRTGLDPFMRQIYAVKRKGKMCLQVGIDGYRLVAERTGAYAGSDDAVLDHEQEPNKATVTVYKIVQGVRCAFAASARWSEYYPGDHEGFMWNKMPCTMLAKVAEALALRKAFPAELSGIYTDDEMAQADASPEAKANQAKPVQSETLSNSIPGAFKMGSEQWKLLHRAADTNNHPRVTQAPSTQEQYTALLDALSQGKPRITPMDKAVAALDQAKRLEDIGNEMWDQECNRGYGSKDEISWGYGSHK